MEPANRPRDYRDIPVAVGTWGLAAGVTTEQLTLATSDDQNALEEQQALLEDCLELVGDAYREALADGMRQPVVILLDCEDQIGGQIARGWLGSKVVDEAIEDQHADDPSGEATTVYVRAVALDECAKQVPTVFPYLRPVFDQPYPADGFLAISVASGGASALTVPFADPESAS